MKIRKSIALTAVFTILSLLTIGGFGRVSTAASSSATKSQEAYTPPKGSDERKAIMDAYRSVWKAQGGNNLTDVVFVVSYLKVQQGWAWLEVSPQSADGSQQYEPEQGLLRLRNGKWRVMDRTSGADKRYFRRLKTKYPAVPVDIFSQ